METVKFLIEAHLEMSHRFPSVGDVFDPENVRAFSRVVATKSASRCFGLLIIYADISAS